MDLLSYSFFLDFTHGTLYRVSLFIWISHPYLFPFLSPWSPLKPIGLPLPSDVDKPTVWLETVNCRRLWMVPVPYMSVQNNSMRLPHAFTQLFLTHCVLAIELGFAGVNIILCEITFLLCVSDLFCEAEKECQAWDLIRRPPCCDVTLEMTL